MGSKGSSSPKIPKAPDPVDLYKRFTDMYLNQQPKFLGAEDCCCLKSVITTLLLIVLDKGFSSPSPGVVSAAKMD